MTKWSIDGGRIRRRVCKKCKHRWYTYTPPEREISGQDIVWRVGTDYVSVKVESSASASPSRASSSAM